MVTNNFYAPGWATNAVNATTNANKRMGDGNGEM